MCGISGIWDLEAPKGLVRAVVAMSDLVLHRGPDDAGWVAVGPAGEVVPDRGADGPNELEVQGAAVLALGHRRLSIIDLSAAGHQPMRDALGRYWMVYNGEIYNYVELRRELESLGRQFVSKTDGEVILQAFLEWGPTCLRRFNGMWAFAIYDSERETLFCARDRFGVKPFYYAGEPRRLAFGSECKQLVSLPWVGARADEGQLADYFLWGLQNHTERTAFSRVLSLPGSHYLQVTRRDLEAGRFVPVRYWRPEPVAEITPALVAEEFRELLFDSVRVRLRSDVPVGATLSGGLDSSSVVCVAGEVLRSQGGRGELDAFNVEFDRDGYSERRFAEAAARRAGSALHVLRPAKEELEGEWQRFVWHLEQPFDGLSYFSNFQIYKLIRRHGIPVVLSGQGGDELLLGYERYRTYEALFAWRARRPLRALGNVLRAGKHAKMSVVRQAAYGVYFGFPALRAARRRQVVKPILRPEFFRSHAGQTEQLVENTVYGSRRELQERELFQHQLPHLLHYDDRAAMAHSIEVRLPLLDYRLLELVLGQPSSTLFRDGWSKHLLRRSMEGILPREVQWRTDKMGYETPTGPLIRQNAEVFLPLLQRHRDDPVIDVRAIERDFGSEHLDSRLLCSAVSYLGWREAFSVT